MKKLILFLVVTSFLLTANSCCRQHLEEGYFTEALIPISVDWKVAGIDPQNVSVLFYDEYSNDLIVQHYFENNDRPVQSYVRVPPGKYNVLVFNELPGQISNVDIGNKDDYYKVEAYGRKASNIRLSVSDDNYIGHTGELASIIVKDFEVTADMVYHTNILGLKDDSSTGITEVSDKLMGLVPLSRLSTLEISIKYKGLDNAYMPALVNVHNMSYSYFFYNNKNGMSAASYQFTAGDRVYDDNSSTEGTVSGSVDLFGVMGDRNSITDQPESEPIILDVQLMLVDKDKTVITRSYNITDLIKFKDESSGTIVIELELTDDDPLPEVEPGSGDKGGFETVLIDWNVVVVPLIAK